LYYQIENTNFLHALIVLWSTKRSPLPWWAGEKKQPVTPGPAYRAASTNSESSYWRRGVVLPQDPLELFGMLLQIVRLAPSHTNATQGNGSWWIYKKRRKKKSQGCALHTYPPYEAAHLHPPSCLLDMWLQWCLLTLTVYLAVGSGCGHRPPSWRFRHRCPEQIICIPLVTK